MLVCDARKSLDLLGSLLLNKDYAREVLLKVKCACNPLGILFKSGFRFSKSRVRPKQSAFLTRSQVKWILLQVWPATSHIKHYLDFRRKKKKNLMCHPRLTKSESAFQQVVRLNIEVGEALL